MLVIRRDTDTTEKATTVITCPDGTVLTIVVTEVGRGWCKLAVSAPPEYAIHRADIRFAGHGEVSDGRATT